MRELDGFPLDLDGSIPFTKPDVHGDTPRLAALGQLIESEIIERVGKSRHDATALSATVAQALQSDRIRPHLVRVHSVQWDDVLLGIEFTATGYPGRYLKHLRLDGPQGGYKLRKLTREERGVTTRHVWAREAGTTLCIGEALNQKGQVVARVQVRLEYDPGDGLRAYDGEQAIREVEVAAGSLARSLAERPPATARR